MTAALLLSAMISWTWAQGTPCVPPKDDPILCPEKYMPKPAAPPTAAERAWVIEAIEKVSAARNAEHTAIEDLKEKLRKAAKAKHTVKTEIARQAYRDLKALTEAKYAACDEAIYRALIAYDLVPPNVDLSGPSGLSPERYNVVTWYPRYSEKEKWDPKSGFWRARTLDDIKTERAENMNKVRGTAGSVGVARAKTRADGSIAIFQAAFFEDADPTNPKPKPDPDRLAMSIMHETSHWVEAGGAGGFRESDPPWHTFLGEYRAYEAEAGLARLLGRDDSHQRNLASQYNRQLVEGKDLTWDQIRSQHPDWLVPKERRVLAPEAEAGAGEPDRPEYLKLEGELALLEAARDAKLIQERLRQEQEAREKEGARGVERLQGASLENIRAAADFTCQMGIIFSGKLDFPKVSDQSFYCRNDPGWSSDDNCQARIYSMLIGQLCRTGTFDPGPINEMYGRVYGPQAGVAPPVLGTNPNPPLGTVEASVPPLAELRLRGLAVKACADPGGVTAADRDALYWFPNPKLFMPASVWEGLTGCARDLLERLVELNRTLSKDRAMDLEWLKAEARRLGEKHSPPPSDPDSGDDRERDRGGNRVGDGNGPARDQAGRIGRGGKWPR